MDDAQQREAIRAARPMISAILVGGIMPLLDSTIVAIAMAQLIEAFHSNAAVMQWVTTAYLLALAVSIPLVGWAQGWLGGRTLWTISLVVFIAGSALCALAWDPGSLIGFRVLQGFGAGLLMTLMQTLPMVEVRRLGITEVGAVIATVSLPMALGPILGPVLGGIVLTWLSWHWLFLINLPIGILALFLARHLGDERSGPRTRLDPLALIALSGGLVGVIYGLSEVGRRGGFGYLSVWLPALVGVLLLAAFVALPSTRDPRRALVDIGLLRLRSLSASAVAMLAAGATLYAAQFLLPLFWQGVRGTSVLRAALLLLPQGVGSLVTRVVAGRLTDRLGTRVVSVAAFLLVALTTVPFALVGAGTSDAALAALLFVRGLALGALIIPILTASYRDLAEEQVAHGAMTIRIGQQVGASLGTALVAVVLSTALRHGHTMVSGFHLAFWTCVGLAVAGAAVAPALPGRQAAPEE